MNWEKLLRYRKQVYIAIIIVARPKKVNRKKFSFSQKVYIPVTFLKFLSVYAYVRNKFNISKQQWQKI